LAQEYCDIRKERYRGRRKMTHSMEKYIREKITTEQWSPRQTVGYAKSQGIPMVSHERIYQLIRKDKADKGILWKHIRHRLKHRKKPVNEYIN
jgi:IS30 family transposase